MTRIKYKLNNGAEQTINGTSGSFTIEQDGTHQIEAWTEDNEGNRSTSANANVTKDTSRTKYEPKCRYSNRNINTSNSKCNRCSITE